MAGSDTHARFESTRASLLEALRSASPERRAAALEEMAAAYWPAVYGFVRRCGHGRADASDITQSFFADVVIGRALLEQADPARGRLRTFLLAALKNHMIDLFRRERVRQQAVALAADGAPGGRRAAPPDDAEAIFERRWARCVVAEVTRRTARRFQLRGQERAWEAFQRTKVGAAPGGAGSASCAIIAKELGYRCGADVAEANRAVRVELRRCLEEVVAEGVGCSASDVAAEIRHVRGALGSRR